jgi:DNA modification methylase
MKTYDEFRESKRVIDKGVGFEVPRENLNPMLFDFQKDIVLWSLRRGRTLIGLNCGLGKGPIQLEWLKQVSCYDNNKPVIMFAPPGVKTQFKYEAEKFGYSVNIIAEDEDIIDGINITNYERLVKREKIKPYELDIYFKYWSDYKPLEIKATKEYIEIERFRFNPKQFAGIALDEASILKHYGAKTRERLTRFAKGIPFRICGTATPAPNDFMELINYVDFLGIMNGKQCRAKYFIQDGNSSNKFRIMRPAWDEFWKFVASWAIMMRSPSDLGYSDDGYVLPELKQVHHILKDTNLTNGRLIAMSARTMSEVNAVKRNTVQERCERVAEIALADDDHKLIFVRRNDEGLLLKKLIPGSVEVAGRHSEEQKEEWLIGFARGEFSTLITKPEIGGFGLNLQEYCHRVISTNVNYSSEEMYQYERRVWRFMQDNSVQHDIITMDTEGDVLIALARKNRQSDQMFEEIVSHMDVHDLYKKEKVGKLEMDYKTDTHREDYWTLMLGDCVEKVKELEDKSIDCVVTSVPFPAMYAYTNSDRDIGNYTTSESLIEHMQYMWQALLPKMKPGRVVHIHLAQGVAHLNREGYIGGWDFRGPIIKMMTEAGFFWDHEWTVEKDPQTERARSNTLGLTQKTLNADAVHMRPSVADYVLKFYAPGKNPEPIHALLSKKGVHGNYDAPDGWITLDMWINWASNVWYKHRKGMKWWEGINVTNVCGSLSKKGRQGFGVKEGRGKDDEKHLCELQLDVIERCIALHSNPGDLVLDPFNGIGSTGFQALKMGRCYIGIELKESYYYTAIKNLQWIENDINAQQYDLFSLNNIVVEGDELLKRHKQWIATRGISLYDRATNWENWERPKVKQGSLL